MTPHEQIIADHRKRATDLRERAVDRDCEAAELRALARAEDAAADYLEHGLAADKDEPGWKSYYARQRAAQAPAPEARVSASSQTNGPEAAVAAGDGPSGAGDIHEPEPDEDLPSLQPQDVEHDSARHEPDAKPWCVAVVGRFGTIHENDFATEEEAQREYLRPMPGCTTILRHNGALQTMRYDDPEPDEARPLPPPWGLHPRRCGQRLRRVSGAVDPPSLRPEDVEHDGELGETIVPPPPAVMDWAREQPGSGHGSPAQTAPEAAASIIAGEEEPRLKTYPRDLVEKLGFGRQKVEAAE